MSSYQQFLEVNQLKLVGYFLLVTIGKDSGVLQIPYPPSVLREEELEALKDQLEECMPLNSIITDLWDWDEHFENYLSDDWYFGAVFGDEVCVDTCSEELVEFFLWKCAEYNMDYDQTDNDPEFRNFVQKEAKRFIMGWRQAVVARYIRQKAVTNTTIEALF